MDNKVRYGRGDGIIEVKVLSDTGAKEELLRSNLKDKKTISNIARLLYEKYGIDLSPYTQFKEKSMFEF